MVNVPYQVVWTKRSLLQIKAAYKYIFKDSPQNAGKVVNDITKAVSKAVPNPEFYGPDKYKINNDGTYRAFEKHSYRISYKITKMTIVVLRVRHTKLEPKPF